MLTRWDPFAEFNRLRSEPRFSPAVDILEEDDAIIISAEIPGMKKDDVEIHIENNILTLSGERMLEETKDTDRYHRVERSYGSFSRAFALPKTVDAEAVEAKLEAGVLRLRVPKKAAAEKRRILIEG